MKKKNFGQTEKLIEELKKDPGITAAKIEQNAGIREDYVRTLLRKLRNSKDKEIERLMDKRQAYENGGSQLLKILKEEPGISYRKTVRELKEKTAGEKMRAGHPIDLFKGLIGYCKRSKDKKIREIIVTHKKKGGWMP